MATTAERVEIVIVAKDEASQALRGISSSIGDVGKIAAGILSAQVLRDLANGFINVGKASINAAAQIETNRTALKTLLGSEQEASKMIKELQELARMTPFSFDSAVTGAKRLMAMGVATEDVQKNLKLIGNAVAAIGGTSDVFDRMIYNLGQVQAQGRATTMDLRQFAMAGIPIYDALSESMGVSSSLLSKMVEEGKIGYAQLTSALQHYYGEGGKFGNMMLEQSQTFSGVMANIKDSFQITLAAFAEDSGLFQAVKDIAGAFLLKMDELAPKLNEVALAIKPLIEEARPPPARRRAGRQPRRSRGCRRRRCRRR